MTKQIQDVVSLLEVNPEKTVLLVVPNREKADKMKEELLQAMRNKGIEIPENQISLMCSDEAPSIPPKTSFETAEDLLVWIDSIGTYSWPSWLDSKNKREAIMEWFWNGVRKDPE